MISGPLAAAELASLVRESLAAGVRREVLHLHLASLSPDLRRPHHQRLLRDALSLAVTASRSRIFDLPNGDVVAVAPPPADNLEAAAVALRRSLDLGAQADAVRRLRLPDSAAALLHAAVESLGLGATPVAVAGVPVGAPSFGTAELAAAERALSGADLESLTFVQRVARLAPDAAPEPLWEDRRVTWQALSQALLGGRDPSAVPALRRRLMRCAEERVLAGLTRPVALRGWRPIGLSLSLATLRSAAFDRFEAVLPLGRRQQVTIGLSAADILADPAGFCRVRSDFRARGLRLALDDATVETLALLRLDSLQLDALRVVWTPRLAAALPKGLAEVLASPGGAERVVLTATDRAAALAWGWEAGIRIFQGPVVDRRMRG